MRIYSIVDLKSNSPANVFTAPTDEIACRMFNDLITVPEDTVFSLHFEDFNLFYLGDFVPGTPCDFNPSCIFEGSQLNRHLVLNMREERLSFLRKLQEVSSDAK